MPTDAAAPVPPPDAPSAEVLRFNHFAIEQMADAAYWITPDARIDYANAAACRMLGYTRAEMQTRTVPDIDLVFTAEAWPGHWAELKRAGSLIFETRHITKDGRIFPVEIRANYLAWGGAECNCALVRDISERKRAEALLQEKEHQLRTLINALPDFICFKDGEGRWLAANEFGLRLFQLADVDYQDQTDAQLATRTPFYREALLGCVASDERAWEAGVMSHCEEVIPCPDGPARTFDTLKVPLFHPDGRRQGLVVIGRDITARKQAELALQASEAQHRNLLQNLNAGVVVHAPDTCVRLHNRRALELLGLSADQMTGKAALDPAWHFVHADGRPMPVEDYPVIRVLRSGLPLSNFVGGIRHPGQRRLVWVLVTAFPDFDASGQLQQIVVTFVDITERQEAEARVAEQLALIETRNAELDAFNRAMLPREMRVLELKQEVNELLARLGEPARYAKSPTELLVREPHPPTTSP